MHYKKTVNIAGTPATSSLVTHFYCEHNVRIFARGNCSLKFVIWLKNEKNISNNIFCNRNITSFQGTIFFQTQCLFKNFY